VERYKQNTACEISGSQGRGFWDVVLEFIALMMEAVHTSETSVYSNEATWRYIL
jgi:hypothetical protein